MKREPEDLLESSPYHGSMVHGAGYTKLIFSYARLIYVCRNTAAAIIAAAFLYIENPAIVAGLKIA